MAKKTPAKPKRLSPKRPSLKGEKLIWSANIRFDDEIAHGLKRMQARLKQERGSRVLLSELIRKILHDAVQNDLQTHGVETKEIKTNEVKTNEVKTNEVKATEAKPLPAKKAGRAPRKPEAAAL